MVALESLVMDAAEAELAPHALEPRRIRDEGTPESVWQTWPGLDAIESVPIEKWIHPAMRLVVVAPHPDDEILACGGLMAMHAARGGSTLVVAVTDGEASHAEVPSWRAGRLAAVPSGSGSPCVAILSLMVTGTPSSAPIGSPVYQRCVEARACARTLSASSKYVACRCGSQRAIWARIASAASSGEKAFALYPASRPRAESS